MIFVRFFISAIASFYFISFANAQNVGIGTTTPGKPLDVNGEVRIFDHLIFNSPNGVINWGSTGNLHFRTNNPHGDNTMFTNRMMLSGVGDLGIGNVSPEAKLDVTGSIRMNNGNQADGRVLTSNPSGVGNWIDIPTQIAGGSATGNTPYWNGTSWVNSGNIYNNNTNIGIGINSPQQKLHISDAGTPNIATIRASGLASTTTLALGSSPFASVIVDANGVMYRGGTTGSPTTGWLTRGNAGTSVVTDFIGTTDNTDLVFRTNNSESFRATNAQRVGIGPGGTVTTKLEVNSNTLDAIYGHSNNVGAYVGYETNFSYGTPPINILGTGIYSSNSIAGYTAIMARSSGAANVAALTAHSDTWIAFDSQVDNSSSVNNPCASRSKLNVTNSTLNGGQIAIIGYSARGSTAGNPGYTIGVQGVSDAQNQDAYGVQGLAYTDSPTRAGGYFEAFNYAGNSQAIAYVGTTFGGISRKITGTNAVSEIIPTADHGRILLTCPESPEYWYQDYGTVMLENGRAHVNLDPILADIIVVNEENPIRVFCTPVDMLEFNGVAIVNRTAIGFDIVELNGGKHSGTLDYQLVVKPKTGYGEGRFPQAPGPAWLKSANEPATAKAANQPVPDKIFKWPSDWEVYKYDVEKLLPIGHKMPYGPNSGKFKVADGVFADTLPVTKPETKQ